MKNIISLLVGLHNNLEYNKHFYETTRKLYPAVEICFVSYGSTDGTHVWMDSLNDEFVKCFHSDESMTFSDTFNKAAEIATKQYVAYMHNDIVIAPNFIENIEKWLDENTIVSYTTIEPPIFAGHERPGKIICDLGIDLKTFDVDRLYSYVDEKQNKYNDKTETGATFFMCMPKDKLLNIGGLDNLYNPMFSEDDDLIRRFDLIGMKLITSLDAICYHFVSKTSRFSEDFKEKTVRIEYFSNRNYMRKWGSRNKSPKYDIGIKIHNSNLKIIDILEPFASNISVDCDFSEYISHHQSTTKFDLNKRVKPNTYEMSNDIIIEFDCNLLTQEYLNNLLMMPKIIENDEKMIGNFVMDIFNIRIRQIIRYDDMLVATDSEYYTSQFAS